MEIPRKNNNKNKTAKNENAMMEWRMLYNGLISRLDMTENKNIWAREYINRIVENWKAKKTNSGGKKKTEQNIQGLQNN